jgi:predicted ATPase
MGTDWKRVRAVFEQALTHAPSERQSLLDEACGNDIGVRREVEALLAAHERPGGFLTTPGPLAAATELWPEGNLPAPYRREERLEIGEVLDGKYRIESLLGAGGMGAVYRATHLQLERPVAVKILLSEYLDEPSMVARFQREAVAVARLRHPHIVTVHDYGVADAIGAYLVMELLEGHSLRDELAEHSRLDPLKTLALLGQVCGAIDAAHRAGVVHRDLKPENIFLERREGTLSALSAKVLDFGLAKMEAVFRSSPGRITHANAILGTPFYMSPEQCQGEDVDARSDVYALGCVAYEMLTGRPPFLARSVQALVYKHLGAEPSRPSSIASDISHEIEEAVLRALAKNPNDRHETAAAFARALGITPAATASPVTEAAAEATAHGARATALIEGIRTGRVQPNNLPQALTGFVGRAEQIAEVREWLSRTRLVTLVGPGGIGKTRLALEVAARVMDDHPDGVWFVPLAALADPESVPQAITAALGVRAQGGRSDLETLTAWLREKSLILILDNCEHLVEACAQLTHSLLEACASLRVLATSREALAVAGEAAWQVPALAVPTRDTQSALACEAVRLFVDRATLAKPGFAVEPSVPAIAALCRRLEGIPLAIELAAARAKVLSVEQILERLDDRFRLLSGGSRTAPTRQQALRATLDWSYELLTDEERMLLRRLSVFAGGWTLEAAEAVIGKDEGRRHFVTEDESEGASPHPSSFILHPSDVLDLLTRLVDKSLVLHDHERGRYGMLETIREYTLEHLWTEGEGKEARRLHALYFLALGETAEPETQNARQTEWFERLETEHDNLRTALEWLLEHDAAACLRLAAALRNLWLLHGHLREGRQWLEAALDRRPAVSATVMQAALRGNGALAMQQGDLDAARVCYEELAELAEAEGDTRQILLATHSLGFLSYRQGDLATARTHFERILAGSKEARQDLLVAATLNSLGEIARIEGSWAEAQRLYEEAVVMWRQEGDHYGLSIALANLGAVIIERGEVQRAYACYCEAIRHSQTLGDFVDVSLSIDGTAAVAVMDGDWERAARLAGAAEGLRETIGYELERADEAFRARYLELIRSQADAANVEARMAEGRAMSPDRAIDYALGSGLRARASLHE